MKRHKISWLGGVHIQEESSEREFWNFLRVLERNRSKWWHPWYPVQQRVYCGPSRTTGWVVPWWSMLLLPRTWIQFLVRELRFHKPHSQKKTKRTTGWINEFKYILGLMEWSLTLHVSVPASPALTHRPAHSSGCACYMCWALPASPLEGLHSALSQMCSPESHRLWPKRPVKLTVSPHSQAFRILKITERWTPQNFSRPRTD